jgi:hypothetical protein
MVSFCDIPFSKITKHIDDYGCYGIGLTRDWAKRSRLNPVLYVQSESMLMESYSKVASSVLNEIEARVKDGRSTKRILEIESRLWDIFRYIKPYEGDAQRKSGAVDKGRRFSDEREWRYVPAIDSSCVPYYYDPEFEDDDAPSEAARSVCEIRLKFEPKDIKYLILKADDEIAGFLGYLSSLSGKYQEKDLQILATRIITAEQIKSDF